MITLQPQGDKIIVLPIKSENFKTASGLEVVEMELSEGEVIEVSTDLSHIYTKGDIVLFPKGAGNSVMYQKKLCLFLNGTGAPKGDIWSIVTKDKK